MGVRILGCILRSACCRAAFVLRRLPPTGDQAVLARGRGHYGALNASCVRRMVAWAEETVRDNEAGMNIGVAALDFRFRSSPPLCPETDWALLPQLAGEPTSPALRAKSKSARIF